MTTTLQVAQAFDTYKVGDQISGLSDSVAQALQKAYPGRFQFGSSDGSTAPSTPGNSSGGTGTGSSSGSGLAPVSYALAGVTSYVATHAFPYSPRAWLIDAVGTEVETDVAYAASTVLLTFPTPFTGTLWLG